MLSFGGLPLGRHEYTPPQGAEVEGCLVGFAACGWGFWDQFEVWGTRARFSTNAWSLTASGLPIPSLINASEIHSLHFSMMQASPRTTSFKTTWYVKASFDMTHLLFFGFGCCEL